MDPRNLDATGVRLNERELGRAASDLLGANSDRRKRGRTSGLGSTTAGLNSEAARKRRLVSNPQSINVAVATRAASALLRESPSYKRLVEIEERLDLAIMRKQQDIKEALKAHTPTTQRIFRLYVFNTYRSQPGIDGLTPDDIPSWSLRIQGQLLPPHQNTAASHTASQHNTNSTGQNVQQSSANTTGNIYGARVTETSPVGSAHGDRARVSAEQGMAQTNNFLEGPFDARNHSALEASRRISAPNQVPYSKPSEEQATQSAHELGSTLRCSDIFKRIVIELDRNVYPESNLVEWKRNERDPPSDGFELSRRGSTECTVRLFLDVNHTPEQFKLSEPLSKLLGVRNDTRSGVFIGLWQYIKQKRLQCVDDRTSIRLDTGLKTLLPAQQNTQEVVKLQTVYSVLRTHLSPPDPLEIQYEIRLSGNVVDNQDCYDIAVNIEDRGLQDTAQKAGIFGLSFPTSAELTALKDKHLEALEQIAHHKRRRDFFEGFCANPVEFINHLILSQTRDLKVLGGCTGRNPEEERRASFYQQQWVHEAIPRYLLRKAIADSAQKTSETALK